jgi:hypothetical protein
MMPDAVWFARIAFGIPILIVVQAVLRDWLRWRKPRASLPEGRLSETQASFHQAEFDALKSQMTEIVKAAGTNFQYAAVGSAAIFTWIATSDRAPGHKPMKAYAFASGEINIW